MVHTPIGPFDFPGHNRPRLLHRAHSKALFFLDKMVNCVNYSPPSIGPEDVEGHIRSFIRVGGLENGAPVEFHLLLEDVPSIEGEVHLLLDGKFGINQVSFLVLLGRTVVQPRGRVPLVLVLVLLVLVLLWWWFRRLLFFASKNGFSKRRIRRPMWPIGGRRSRIAHGGVGKTGGARRRWKNHSGGGMPVGWRGGNIGWNRRGGPLGRKWILFC